METFLDQVILKINSEYKDISNVIVVLPSKRACLFFKDRLVKSGLRSSWLPTILTLNQLIEKVFPGRIENSLTLLSELYSIARKMGLKEAATFEDFYRWGDVLLHDFSTIESYAVNGSDLYRNLKDIELLERWSFSEERLSENQILFNDFWMKQGEMYHSFVAKLRAENRASGAMALRWVAENASSLESFETQNFIIAGFNALSLSEQKLINELLKIGNSFYLPDNDDFFIHGNREAGYFHRQLIKKYNWKGLKELPQTFSSSEKKIEMISVTQRSALSLVCSQLLRQSDDLSDTALVLGDESMLESIITALPDNVGAVNITMGYKLRNTPVYDLFLSFYSIQLRMKKKANEIYHKDLIRFLNHPYIAQVLGAKVIREVKRLLVTQNLIFINKKHLASLQLSGDHIELLTKYLFVSWKHFPKDPSEQIIRFIDALQSVISEEKQALDLEYLFHFKKTIQALSLHIENYQIKLGLNGYKVLFSELLKNSSISFQGEPLEGLQIMGLLETRALDFKRVILVGANEGSIPKTTTPQSFIPWDLKNYFGLPGRKEQDALYAYYFYRLINRPSELSLLYTTHSGKDLASTEASRYLRQLAYYNKQGETHFKIAQYQTNLAHIPQPIKEVKLVRNDFYRRKLKEKLQKSLSPTALSAYLNCPLDFYFRYILGLQESDTIDEEIGADVIGNIIHKVLDALYKPYINAEPDFKEIWSKLDDELKLVIAEEMKNRWINTGMNRMQIQIIETLLEKFLKLDESFIKEQVSEGRSFKIVKVEEALSRKYEFEIEGEHVEINLRGFADRIDRIDDRLRIIDYKTGKVDKLSNVEVEKVFHDGSYSKALQLLMYQAMFDNFSDPDLRVGIIGFRDLSKYVQSVQLKKADRENLAAMFAEGLKDLVSSMLYSDEEIMHNPKSKWCKFCELH